MPEVDNITPTSENLSDPSTPNECHEEQVEMVKISSKDDLSTGELVENENENENEKEEDEWLDILDNGQLRIKIIRKGEPDSRPQISDICNIKLQGKLDDGKIVEEYNSLRLTLGDHEVVHGLELALPLMHVGEEAMVIVAPRFAYGSIGNPPDIPPDATITYTVELLKVDYEPDLQNIPYEKRKILANLKREKGNWWYSRQDATKAIQCYRKALDMLNESIPYINESGESEEITKEMIMDMFQQRLKVFNNLAAAQLMSEAYQTALSSVNEVIKHEPNNVKALFRKGKILTAIGCTNEAVDTLRKAFVLEPENGAVKMELSKCVKQQQIEKQHEKNLYKKMLCQDLKSERSVERSKGRSGLWTKILGTAATATLMAAVAVAISYKFKNYPFL